MKVIDRIVAQAQAFFDEGYRLSEYMDYGEPCAILEKDGKVLVNAYSSALGDEEIQEALGLSGDGCREGNAICVFLSYLGDIEKSQGQHEDQIDWFTTVLEAGGYLLYSVGGFCKRAARPSEGSPGVVEVYHTDTNQVSARINLTIQEVRWGQKSPSQDW